MTGPDRYARQRAELERSRTVDFDAWRARQVTATPTIRIGGRVFALPKQAPLLFTLERQRLDTNRDLTEDEARNMVRMLFGADALDHFVATGLDHDDLSVLLMWGGANVGATAERVSLDEARTEYERMAVDLGKGGNRAARRKSGKRGRGRK